MQFVEGKHEITLPTYFIGDYGEAAGMVLSSAKLKAEQMGLTYEGVPVCKNLFWLKGSGIFNLKGQRTFCNDGFGFAYVFSIPKSA